MSSLPSSSSCSSSSSSTSISQDKYDVFLSFRGDDTRKNFTAHLYAALRRKGIFTFMDERKLEVGEEIAPELLKAIQESWCSLVVFSKTYAFSGWCLDELVEIVKQKNERRHKVFPIFYAVNPSDLRRQTRKVAEAFAIHEERYKQNKDKTQRWRNALTEVANIKGCHLNDRNEAEFIEDIVKRLSTKLYSTYSKVPNHDKLIGINARLEELHSKINIGEDDVRVIGICGMGGIGKTTIARAAYSQMSPYFEGKCFLSDVREVSEKYGLVSLQNQILSHILSEEGFRLFNVYDGNDMISRRLCRKKVVVVIDDADSIKQLECLVGERHWFGLGSRIIVTTRDEHLLEAFGVDDMYKPATLDEEEAFRLFNLKAFKRGIRPNIENLSELSLQVIRYADGLPLALEVLGSFLCGRDATQWRSAVERLKRDCNKQILDILQISFDGLENSTEKEMFLDIACFFKGENIDFATKIWEACEFFPEIGIDVLIKKSLITVNDNKLCMHDMLQQMGRNIVRQKSINEPGRRCRLWEEKDVYHVLRKNTGTEVVQGMFFQSLWEQNKMFTLSANAFSKMTNLRLLKTFYLQANSRDLVYLSDELWLLDWLGYPFKSLPSSFYPENLVILLMPHSSIEKLWEGKKPLNKLKLVDLKDSWNLISIPDLSMATNLESLDLEGCTNLLDIHPSIGILSRLKIFNLKGCKCLRNLPTIKRMESLETLILSSCSNLQRFPEIERKMECLWELYLDGAGIKELPSSIGHLIKLRLLDLRDCKSLKSFPTINGMKSLEKLILSGCSSLLSFPEIEGKMERLQMLFLDRSGIKELSSSIQHLSGLKLLHLSDCKSLRSFPTIQGMECLERLILSGCSNLQMFPEIVGEMKCLTELNLEGTAIKELPSSIGNLNRLNLLNLKGCKNLWSLSTDSCESSQQPSMSLSLAPLSGLHSLGELILSDCNLCEGAIPSSIGCLSSLVNLFLDGNNFISLPTTLSRLSKLSYLKLSNCKLLKSVPTLPASTSAAVDGCTSLEVIADPIIVSDSMDEASIYALNCFKLVENNYALTMLKRHLKVIANARPKFDILLPGNEIPEWFIHQHIGSGIGITLPPTWRNDNQFMGFAFCCVLTSASYNKDTSFSIQCSFLRNNKKSSRSTGFRLPASDLTNDHLWIRYISRENFVPMLEEFYLTGFENEGKGIVISYNSDAEVLVKKCGFRAVYQDDVEDIDDMMKTLMDHGNNNPTTSTIFYDMFKTLMDLINGST